MSIPTSSGDPSQQVPDNPGQAMPGTEPEIKRHVRVGTMVCGAFLVAAAVIIIAVAAGATIDVELTIIIGLAVAGVALVIGSIFAGMRRSRRQQNGTL